MIFELIAFVVSGGFVGGFVAWRHPRIVVQVVNVPADPTVEVETEGPCAHDWHVQGTEVRDGRKRIKLSCLLCDGKASRKAS